MTQSRSRTKKKNKNAQSAANTYNSDTCSLYTRIFLLSSLATSLTSVLFVAPLIEINYGTQASIPYYLGFFGATFASGFGLALEVSTAAERVAQNRKS